MARLKIILDAQTLATAAAKAKIASGQLCASSGLAISRAGTFTTTKSGTTNVKNVRSGLPIVPR